MTKTIQTDVLVVGGGAAGMRAALEARLSGAQVLLTVKGHFAAVGVRGAGASGNGRCCGGGVLYAHEVQPWPPPEESLEQAIQLGLGLADPKLVRILIEDSTRNRSELAAFNIHLNKGPGWGVRAHGVPLVGGLAGQIRSRGVAVRDRFMIVRLLVQDGEVTGAVGVDETSGEVIAVEASAVVLATGGDGRIFRHTFDPSCVTGDGYAMGYEAGATLMNIEFKQVFLGVVYPTQNNLYLWAWQHPVKLTNALREPFLSDYCPPGVAPDQVLEQHARHDPASTRDSHSRFLELAIIGEVVSGRGTPHDGVWVDYRGCEHLLKPSIAEWYRYRGIFSNDELIEASVCHHCSNGGFRIDENAQTTVPGLYAVGECLAGPWGADRRGGHMLAGTQVFGARAGRDAARRAREGSRSHIDQAEASGWADRLARLKSNQGTHKPSDLKKALQITNWRELLFARSAEGLRGVLAEVSRIRDECASNLQVDNPRSLVDALELENMLTVSEIIARAALKRQESRGSHYRLDFPERNDEDWLRSVTATKVDGKMEIGTLVPDPNWQDRAGDVGDFRWG